MFGVRICTEDQIVGILTSFCLLLLSRDSDKSSKSSESPTFPTTCFHLQKLKKTINVNTRQYLITGVCRLMVVISKKLPEENTVFNLVECIRHIHVNTSEPFLRKYPVVFCERSTHELIKNSRTSERVSEFLINECENAVHRHLSWRILFLSCYV